MKELPKDFRCSKCNKKSNTLFSSCCQKCQGKACPSCEKRKSMVWVLTFDFGKQLRCLRCGGWFEFLNNKKLCNKCLNENCCFCDYDSESNGCNLCGEKIIKKGMFFCKQCYMEEVNQKIEFEADYYPRREVLQRNFLLFGIVFLIFAIPIWIWWKKRK